jgi:hypothetical protein
MCRHRLPPVTGVICLQGKDIPEMLINEIKKAGITPKEAHDWLVVQCFDLYTLEQFSKHMQRSHYDIPLVLLADCKAGLPGTAAMQKLSSLASQGGVGCATLCSCYLLFMTAVHVHPPAGILDPT